VPPLLWANRQNLVGGRSMAVSALGVWAEVGGEPLRIPVREGPGTVKADLSLCWSALRSS
jgi:hypothetical protein